MHVLGSSAGSVVVAMVANTPHFSIGVLPCRELSYPRSHNDTICVVPRLESLTIDALTSNALRYGSRFDGRDVIASEFPRGCERILFDRQ